MDALQQWGLDLIRTVQEVFGLGVEPFFEAITFTADQQFLLLLVPLLLWCVDFWQAVRLSMLYLLSGVLNTAAKEVLMQPRPCVFEEQICISDWYGYGLPSGHSQTALVVWTMLADWSKKTWVWAAAVVLTLLVGLSRVYLGVHFPTDVLGGWGLGIVILLLYFGFGKRVESWLKDLSMASQIGLAIFVALAFIVIWPVGDMIAAAGTTAGVGIGLAFVARYVQFSARGPLRERVLRYVVGVVVVTALFFGLRAVFPGEGESLYLPFRLVRYGLVGIWVSFGAPWLFGRLGIGGNAEDEVRQATA